MAGTRTRRAGSLAGDGVAGGDLSWTQGGGSAGGGLRVSAEQLRKTVKSGAGSGCFRRCCRTEHMLHSHTLFTK